MHARPQGFARQASNPQGWQAMLAKRYRYRARPHASKQGRESRTHCARMAQAARVAGCSRANDGRRWHEGRDQAARGTTGEARSASGGRPSRMSAPNLGAHRTPTPATLISPRTTADQCRPALLPQNCGVAVQQHEILDVLDQISTRTRQLLRVLKATRGRHEYRRSLRL